MRIVVLLLACIVGEVVRELCFKRAAAPLGRDLSSGKWTSALANRFLWAGLAIWVLETGGWIAVLETVPLGIAYPISAASYALAPLMGWWLLSERLGRSQVAGVLLVTAGAACVGLSGR